MAYSNRVYIFSDVGAIKGRHAGLAEALADASQFLQGEDASDGFGVLPSTPRMDLDGDRADDLLIGAPGATVTTVQQTANAGRVYVVYGGRSSTQTLPTTDTDLVDRTVPGGGGGNYLVDLGTGQPFVQDDSRLRATGDH